MIDEKLLIEVLKQRISSHEKDADDFKEYEIKFDMEEMLLRLADECQAIIELIDKQPKVNEWIPCSERLPDDKDYVLICAAGPDEGVFIAYYVEESNKWLYETDEGLYYEVHVLAWMPLPDPYQA